MPNSIKIGAILFQIVLLCLFRQFTADNRAKKCVNRPFWKADLLSDDLRCTEKEGTRFPQPRFSPFECSRFVSFHEPTESTCDLIPANLLVTTPRPTVTVLPIVGETFLVLRNNVRKKLSNPRYLSKPFRRYRNRRKTTLWIISDL